MQNPRRILHSIALHGLATLIAVLAAHPAVAIATHHDPSGESTDGEVKMTGDAGEATAAVPITVGDSELPDTPAGALVARYVEAYNSNSDEAMSAFIASSFDEVYRATKTDQEHLDVYRLLYDRHFGPITVERVIRKGDVGLTVLFRSEKGPLAEFGFKIGPETPTRISGMRVAVVGVDQGP